MTCKTKVTIFLLSFALCINVFAKTYYVAPSGGSDYFPGTKSQPWATWQKAFSTAQAGDTVYFRGGTWYPTTQVDINYYHPGNSGTHNHPICYFNYPDETPVIDFINLPESPSSRSGIDINNVTYIKFKGLTVQNVRQTTPEQWISGINSTVTDFASVLSFENVVSRGHGGAGFWLGGIDTLYLINCDSYNNCDPTSTGAPGGRADGWTLIGGGAITDTLRMIYIQGCRAWNNSDDGIDIAHVKGLEVHNNWVWNNGHLSGGGTGIKLEYSVIQTPDKRKIYNNVTAYNSGGGFSTVNLTDEYYGPFSAHYNNSSYRDYYGYGDATFGWIGATGIGYVIYRNNISFKPTEGSQAALKAYNYGYPYHATQDHNTWIQRGFDDSWYTDPNPAYTVTDLDFVSLDTAQLRLPRKPDGSLPDITFMKLASTSDLIDKGVNVGFPYSGAAPDIGASESSVTNPNNKPVISITVTGAGGVKTISIDNGTLQLSAAVLPADAATKTVTWSITSGKDKASISSTGLITALDNGIVVARATANDGSGVFGTLTITISDQVIAVTSIAVTGTGGATTITIDNGTLQLSANVLPSNATNKAVTWSILSGMDKASISSTGLVTALDNGTATARATAIDGSGVYGILSINITNQVIPVTSISVKGAGGATTIAADNGTLQLSADVLPSNATNKAVTWSLSSGSNKATISSTGLVTALDNGTAVARATANDGSGVYGTLTITIANQVIPVSSISLAGAGGVTLITTLGGTLQLNETVLPANATNKTVTWSITIGTDKASISSKGLLTALDNGTAVAKATANDGSGVYGVLTITISNQIIAVANITVTGTGGTTTVTIDNGTLQLSAAVLPADAANKTVTWSITSGSDNASISSTGLITALNNGTAVVRATANDGSGVYGTLTVTISNQVINVTSITITGTGGATTITTDNGTLQLSAGVLPADATNKTVTWSITNGTDKASISSTGLVTALDNGTATVRAIANDGSGIYGVFMINITNQITIVNSPPVIVINYQLSSYSGFVNEINASGSHDNDKDILTYTWVVPNNITVSSTSNSSLKYLGPIVSSPQIFEFTLIITDGKTTQSKVIPIEILPYKPELEVAKISNIEASSFQPPYYPYNAIDGDIGTMWSAEGTSQSLIIELKQSFSVQHVKLAFQPGQRRESYFDVLGSVDKLNWEPILVKSASCDFSGETQVFVFPPSKTNKEFNYIKLAGLGNSEDTWNYISELKILGYRHRNNPDYDKLPVKVYPNPAHEFVIIRIDESAFEPDFIQLIDLFGVIIFRSEVDPNIKEFEIPINLKKGLYIVRIGKGNLTLFTQKLVVN
jgi:uncharacterized protein YjdB